MLQQICRHLAADLLSTSRYQDAFAWLKTAWWRQACCKLSTDLMQVDCQNLLSTSLLQVVSTSCNKSANDKLQQAGFWDLFQLDEVAKFFDKPCCNIMFMKRCRKDTQTSAYWNHQTSIKILPLISLFLTGLMPSTIGAVLSLSNVGKFSRWSMLRM